MKKILSKRGWVLLALIVLGFGAELQAMAQSDPTVCPTEHWEVTLNDGDRSSREDLLSLLDLIGENGAFQVNGVMSFARILPGGGRYLFLSHDKTYFADPIKNEQNRRGVLSQLMKIPGTVLFCSPESTPPGGVSGSN